MKEIKFEAVRKRGAGVFYRFSLKNLAQEERPYK